MRRADLAKKLIGAPNDRARYSLLAQYPRFADIKLADEIRKGCYAAWTVNPADAQRAAKAISCLAKSTSDDEITATAFWITGVADITKARFESAVENLNSAGEMFRALGRTTVAAQTQVAKLLALAMLGRYDEAIQTGEQTLRIFVRAGDDLAAGKIEMNLSNIVSRRSLHRQAEKYCRSALKRFINVRENSWKAMAENGLASTYAELNEFEKADQYYRFALETARSENMLVTEAEIEANLGDLALLRGRYAEALSLFEISRQKYDTLGLPHQSAIADLEIAEIYSELNLDAEAAEIYTRVAAEFRRLKLRAEEARTRLNWGRTALVLGDLPSAKRELTFALKLFEKEQNVSGKTAALLSLARLAIETNELDGAENVLRRASISSRNSENPRYQIQLTFLEGEVLRQMGQYTAAAKKLGRTETLARKFHDPDAQHAAHNSQGMIAVATGNKNAAKRSFRNAIRIIERLRSPLGNAQAGIAFFGSRLEPYQHLARLLLSESKIADAFQVIEASRGRALLDASRNADRAGLAGTQKLRTKFGEVRAELNLNYKRYDHAGENKTEVIAAKIARLEKQLAELLRQINNLESASRTTIRSSAFTLRELQEALDASTTLVEFVEFDGKLSAFVVTKNKINYVANLTTASEILGLLEELQFQFGGMRYGAARLGKFAETLKARADECFRQLYDQIYRPLENYISTDRLIVVSAGVINYVPFGALYDGRQYFVEQVEISYAPSAAVWATLQGRRSKKIKNSLVIGYADEKIPEVENEIREIKPEVPSPQILVGDRATFSGFIENAPKFDLIHMACHGKFRADSPMFSSLHLADGWVTVEDICSQRLRARLVTLSACETGLNKVAAGEEILGLARGFLVAGAESLLVSLWAVNDAATGDFMGRFYNNLQRGSSIAASVRQAQLEFVGRGEHPFFWAPFILIGK